MDGDESGREDNAAISLSSPARRSFKLSNSSIMISGKQRSGNKLSMKNKSSFHPKSGRKKKQEEKNCVRVFFFLFFFFLVNVKVVQDIDINIKRDEEGRMEG